MNVEIPTQCSTEKANLERTECMRSTKMHEYPQIENVSLPNKKIISGNF
jgi:hypothetical protein